MTSFSAIPQNKLNALQERVCSPINYLCTKINSATPLWDGPIKMCRQIEDDQFAVDTVVMEAKKYNGLFNGINTPRIYHAILCRVYILLYYLHHDDQLYEEIVFPRLKENMGVYNDTHLKTINEQIDKILAQEKLFKKVQEEKKKDVKPVFAYVYHERKEMDHLYIEYNEEELFRGMSGIIKGLIKEFDTEQDEANVWFNAKRVVQTLRDVKRPELLIERAAKALEEGQIYNEYESSQIILLCTYAMIRSSKNNEHFEAFIKTMEDMSSAPCNLQVIQRSIRYVKKWVDEHPITDGYDYIGEPSAANDTYTSADIERIRKQIIEHESAERKNLQQEYSVLQQENSELKKDYEQLEKLLAQSKGHTDVKEQKAANAYEKIIFFATVLSVAYDDRFTNQTSLSNLICMVCGGSPSTYQPRISKLAKMADEGKYEDEVLNAARNLIAKLKAIPKEDDKGNPVVNKYIESISSEFGVQ